MKAIIGMNYGDEGKGHIVDYFSSPNTLVVRHNGGAQAAHAVVTPSGDEHVFHHFGSGALRGARTLLARRFILNPIIFMKELGELLRIVSMRETLIDPRCIVTTPYDMMINRYCSASKGAHDTVGLGINETVERSLYDQLIIKARDIKNRSGDYLMDKMKQLENEWVPFRLEQLKINPDTFKRWAVDFLPSGIEESFIECAKWMIDRSVLWEDANTIDRFMGKGPGRDIVFEGAQGMLLDQRRNIFAPYLTRSNTGIKNVMNIVKDMNTDLSIEPILVTRAYLTRHGDGPMFSDDSPYSNLSDASNPDNDFQGSIRFGTLDANWFDEAIEETKQKSRVDKLVVAMTCLDHVDSANPKRSVIRFWNGEDRAVLDMNDVGILSFGRTFKEVEVV